MTSEKCRNCSELRYKQCPAPNVILYGKYYCEQADYDTTGCTQCGEPLQLGHFAYKPNWKEFWCEKCLKDLLYDSLT